MLRRSNSWTVEQDDALKAMIDEGLEPDEVAAELGKSRNAIIGRAWRLSYNRWPSAKERAMSDKPRKKRIPTKKEPLRVKPLLVPPLPPNPVVPEVIEPPVTHHPLTWELEPRHCRWIVVGTGAEAQYCGRTRPTVGPYCAKHREMAWSPTRRR